MRESEILYFKDQSYGWLVGFVEGMVQKKMQIHYLYELDHSENNQYASCRDLYLTED